MIFTGIVLYKQAKNLFFKKKISKCIAMCKRAIKMLLKEGLLHDESEYVDIFRVLARARLALADFHGAEDALLGSTTGVPGALNVDPRYSDAYYDLYLIHQMMAANYLECWKAEIDLRKQTGEKPACELVHKEATE